MLTVFILDLLFMAGSVYLILKGAIVAGAVMILMGGVATAIGVMRLAANRSRSDRAGQEYSSPRRG